MSYLKSDSYTYESILSDMLSRIPKDIDKREGSIIYNALAPAALKLAEAYMIMDNNIDLVFLDTAAGEYLDRRCEEHGISRRNATTSTRKGTFKNSESELIDIPIGSRFRLEDTTYIAIEKITIGAYQLKCEQAGIIGNTYNGILLPLDNIPNLALATLEDILIYGEDIETDDELKLRTKITITNTESDGNINQYLKWASEFEGVGRAKVFSMANGSNTVKVSITDSKNQVATSELIKKFQNYLDPNSTGLGNGKAPIGAKVIVVTGNKVTINVAGTVKLNPGYSQVEGASGAIENYLSSIAYAKDTVSYIRLASEILNLPSVSDVSTLTINGGNVDLPLGNEDIPMIGSVTLEVGR